MTSRVFSLLFIRQRPIGRAVTLCARLVIRRPTLTEFAFSGEVFVPVVVCTPVRWHGRVGFIVRVRGSARRGMLAVGVVDLGID